MSINKRRLKDALVSCLDDVNCPVHNNDRNGLMWILFWYRIGYITSVYSLLARQPFYDLFYGNLLLVHPNLILILCLICGKCRGIKSLCVRSEERRVGKECR